MSFAACLSRPAHLFLNELASLRYELSKRGFLLVGRHIERSKIPLSNLLRHVVFGQRSSHPKVAYFDLTIVVHEHIGRLDVTVHDAQLVKEVEAQQRVVDDRLHVLLVNFRSVHY